MCNNWVRSLSTHKMQMACTDKKHTRYSCWLLVVVIPKIIGDSEYKTSKKYMYSSRCIDIKYWKRTTLCANKRDVKRMEMSNLSTTFSKSIMKNKIWVYFYGTWEQEFSARRRKHTSCAHIKRKRFGHGYVEVFKEYETTRKFKKLEWEKRCFFFNFLSYFCIRCVKHVLGKLRYSCSEAVWVEMQSVVFKMFLKKKQKI